MGLDESDEAIDKLWTALRFFAYGPGGIDEHGRHYQKAIFQLQALAAHDPDLRRRFTRNYRYTVDLIASIITEGIEAGTFHPVDPEATAVFLVATVDGARNTELSLDVDATRETALDGVEQFVSELLVE